MRWRWIALVGIVALAYGCTPGARRVGAPGKSPVIRALIAEGSKVRVEATGAFRVKDEDGSVLLGGGGAGVVEVEQRGLTLEARMDGKVASTDGLLEIVPAGPCDFRVSGVPYGGRLRLSSARSGRMLVVNELPLEDYLEGVVPHEIGNPGPDAFAALEAQAVAARTYAISRIEARRGEPFDVFAGVRDQVYRGKERRDRSTTAAVRETRGMVLEYDGQLCRAYYCATCGGHTSDIRNVWPQREDAAYLRGSLDRTTRERESFCSWVRNFRWRYSFSGKELGRVLRKTLPAELGVSAGRVGSFVDVSVAERDASGRVRRLEIETTEGTFVVESDRIRWVLMADADRGRILPSTMFKIDRRVRNGNVVFVTVTGGGNGHGVGMCQNGAIGMARAGYSYRMILSHYYPGTTPARRY
jgi:stage II sporulation protein D